MPVGGERSRVVEVVEQDELLGESMMIRRYLAPELHQARVSVALSQFAQELIVGPVFLDDVEDVLEDGWVPRADRDRLRGNPSRGRARLCTSGAAARKGIPAVVFEHRSREQRQL